MVASARWLAGPAVLLFVLIAGGRTAAAAPPSPTTTVMPTPTVTRPPTATPSPAPTATPRTTYALTATQTATVTRAPSASLTPTPTATPRPTYTLPPTVTATPVLPTATPTPRPTEPVAGTTRVRDADGMVMVYVPAGEFIMGGTLAEVEGTYAACRQAYGDICRLEWFGGEVPRHMVYLDGYWIDRTEVTNEQYARFVEATRYRTQAATGEGGWVQSGRAAEQVVGATWRSPDGTGTDIADRMDHPVVQVSWNDAQAYCLWAGAQLPGEAQWEKAARGTDGRTRPWGSRLDGSHLNFCDRNCELSWRDASADDGYARTAPAGSYPGGASPYGALDMAGNVAEWVADWYAEGYYARAPLNDPPGPVSGNGRVVRGGAWGDGSYFLRVALRTAADPSYARDVIGFRCALSPRRTPATASATPTPTYDALVTAKVGNLRSGPGTLYPITGQVAQGDGVNITAKNADGEWVEVKVLAGDELQGWLSLSLLEPRIDLVVVAVPAEIPPAPVAPTPAPAATPVAPAGPTAVFEVPAGKALLLMRNYTGSQWNINFGNYLLVVPPKLVSEEVASASLVIDPGTYVWQGHSPDGQRITNPDNGATEFEFTVAAGQVHEEVIR